MIAVADSSMPRTNPDGDVELPGADYNNFTVPECAHCLAEGRDMSIVSSMAPTIN